MDDNQPGPAQQGYPPPGYQGYGPQGPGTEAPRYHQGDYPGGGYQGSGYQGGGYPGNGYQGGGYQSGGAPSAQSVREQLSSAQQKLPGHLPRIPLELLAVCGVMALSGLLLLWPSLSLLSDGFPLLGDGSAGLAIGLLAIDIGVMILAFAAVMLLLAWRLSHADRVARGISYVILGAIAFAGIVGGDHSVGLIIVMLLSLACIAVLALVPPVKQFFTGRDAPHGSEPVSVTMARTLLTWFAGSAIFLGVTFLLMGVIGAQMIAAGIVFIGVGAGVLVLSSRLARGEPNARLITSALVAAYALLALIGGGRNTATLLDLGVAAGIACLLWLPQDARQHFDQPASQRPPAFGGQGPGGQGYGGQGYGGQSHGGQNYSGAGYGAPNSSDPNYGDPGNGGQPPGAPGYGVPPR